LLPTSESPALFDLPAFPWTQVPRWGIYTHTALPNLYSVVAVRGQHVLTQTGIDLSVQAKLLKAWVQAEWDLPSAGKWARQVEPVAAWVMPNEHLESFEWPCSNSWGPQDIEAECRLEASSRMQVPASQLALDYEVQRSSEGQLWVKVWMCQQTQIDACVAQVQAQGWQLKVVTRLGQLDELASFFKRSVQAQHQLHQHIVAEATACLEQGVMAC
jgi:hypothetical protein